MSSIYGEKKGGILECILIYYILSPHAGHGWITWVLLEAKPSDFIRFSTVFLHVLKYENETEIWTSQLWDASS